MADVDIQMAGIIKPKYDKRRKGFVFKTTDEKSGSVEILVKTEDEQDAINQLKDMLSAQKEKEDAEKVAEEESKKTTHSFAEGGMEDGGLKDEGGTVDPVSGNEVPSGSTQEEVRDDIPAQLSEGEFVFPADVVRYIGLENLMELRSKAKQGLAKMEAMGQMGNSEEATMDDDGKYEGEIDELIENFDPNNPETMSFAEGGVVHAQQGAFVPGMPQQQFSYGYMPPQQQVGYQPPQVPATQFPDYSQFVSRPAQAAVGEQRGITEQRQYIGPNGEMITILFMDGKPQQEIPAGYKVYKPEEGKPEVKAPVVQQPSYDGGDGPEEDNRTQLEKDMARTEPKTRDVAQDLINNLTDPEAKNKVQTQLDKLNKAVKAAYAAPFATMIPGVGIGIAGQLVRNAIKEDDAMDALIKEVSGLSTRQYRDEQLTRAADQGLDDVVRDAMEQQFGSGYLDRDELDALSSRSEQDRINSFNDIVNAAGRSDLAIETDQDSDETPSEPSRGPSGPQGDPYDEPSYNPGTGGGDGPGSDSDSGADRNDPSDPGGGFGPSFSKGGLADQTQRALKSSRKKK